MWQLTDPTWCFLTKNVKTFMSSQGVSSWGHGRLGKDLLKSSCTFFFFSTSLFRRTFSLRVAIDCLTSDVYKASAQVEAGFPRGSRVRAPVKNQTRQIFFDIELLKALNTNMKTLTVCSLEILSQMSQLNSLDFQRSIKRLAKRLPGY